MPPPPVEIINPSDDAIKCKLIQIIVKYPNYRILRRCKEQIYLLKPQYFDVKIYLETEDLHVCVCVCVCWEDRVTSSCPMYDKGFTNMLLKCQNDLKVHVCTVSFLYDLKVSPR